MGGGKAPSGRAPNPLLIRPTPPYFPRLSQLSGPLCYFYKTVLKTQIAMVLLWHGGRLSLSEMTTSFINSWSVLRLQVEWSVDTNYMEVRSGSHAGLRRNLLDRGLLAPEAVQAQAPRAKVSLPTPVLEEGPTQPPRYQLGPRPAQGRGQNVHSLFQIPLLSPPFHSLTHSFIHLTFIHVFIELLSW